MSIQTFWSEKRWTLGFGEWGKDYTIVQAAGGGGYHVGLDSATDGDIPCLIAGTVVSVLKTLTMGYCVEIDTGPARAGRGRYFTYCHIAGDNVPRKDDVIGAGGRVGRTARGPRGIAYASVEFPGSAWYGIHCHLVISDYIHAAWTTVKGRTLAAFYDPAPIIRSVLSNPAGDGGTPLPTETKEWDEMATEEQVGNVVEARVKKLLTDHYLPKPAGVYNVIHFVDDNGIYIVGALGKRVHIATPAHVDMLQRNKTDSSTMNFAENEICRGYITAANPPVDAEVDTAALAAKLAALTPEMGADAIKAACKAAIAETTLTVKAG